MTWTCPRCGDCCGGDVPEGAAFILCGSCGYQDLHPSTCRAEIRFSKLAGWTVADSLAEADRLEREAAEIERRIAPDAARAAALTARVLALREGAMRPAVDAIAAFFLAAARPDPAPPPCSHDWRPCDCDVPGCTDEVCETCSLTREGSRRLTAASQSPVRERWSNFTINYEPPRCDVFTVKKSRAFAEQIAKDRRPNRVVADDRDSTPPAPNCLCCRTPAQWGGLAWVCPRCGRVPPSPWR